MMLVFGVYISRIVELFDKRISTIPYLILRGVVLSTFLLGYVPLVEARHPPYGYPSDPSICQFNSTSLCASSSTKYIEALPNQRLTINIAFTSNEGFFYNSNNYGLQFIDDSTFTTFGIMKASGYPGFRILMNNSGSNTPSWDLGVIAPSVPGTYSLGYSLYYFPVSAECGTEPYPVGEICPVTIKVLAPVTTTTSTTSSTSTTRTPTTTSSTATVRSTTTTFRAITTSTTSSTSITTTTQPSSTSSTTTSTLVQCPCGRGRKKRACLPCPSTTSTTTSSTSTSSTLPPTPTPPPPVTPFPMPPLPDDNIINY